MKLLATDMDGTFLRDDKSYSEEFNDLYKQMLKQGIQFVIASGNQYEALACKFDEEIKGNILVASYNEDTFNKNVKLSSDNILIVGDRHEIIENAINSKIKLLIVTGNGNIKKENLES